MAQATTKTMPATNAEINAFHESIGNFLLARHFEAHGENEFSGVNREFEFHLTLLGDSISITATSRFDYESYVDSMPINDNVFANLMEMIGR